MLGSPHKFLMFALLKNIHSLIVEETYLPYVRIVRTRLNQIYLRASIVHRFMDSVSNVMRFSSYVVVIGNLAVISLE